MSIIKKFNDKLIIFKIRLSQKKGNLKKTYYYSQKYWKRKGVVFGGDRAIAFYTSNLDVSTKNMIFIGDNTMITAEAQILVHDYSIQKGLEIIDKDFVDHTVYHVEKVVIGENCFIGNRAIILPGTTIGNNCIVGAGAVCRGKYEDDSIIIGNPAVVVGKTSEWASKKDDTYYTFERYWKNFQRKK